MPRICEQSGRLFVVPTPRDAGGTALICVATRARLHLRCQLAQLLRLLAVGLFGTIVCCGMAFDAGVACADVHRAGVDADGLDEASLSAQERPAATYSADAPEPVLPAYSLCPHWRRRSRLTLRTRTGRGHRPCSAGPVARQQIALHANAMQVANSRFRLRMTGHRFRQSSSLQRLPACPAFPCRNSSSAACSSRSNGNGPCATMKS